MNTHLYAISFSASVRDFAGKWLAADAEYIHHQAEFAAEPIRSSARLILMAADQAGGEK